MQSRSVFKQVGVGYEALIKVASSFQSIFLLAVRLYWGWQFAQTGWGKLQHLPKVTAYFTSLGIPAPEFSAMAIAWLEFVGGIALALGIGSRFWGLLLAGDMLVAYLTAGRQNLLSIFSDPGKFYGDDAYTFFFASLLILLFGPGELSVDGMLKRVFPADEEYRHTRTVSLTHSHRASERTAQ
jgi:putative oxidoreductase